MRGTGATALPDEVDFLFQAGFYLTGQKLGGGANRDVYALLAPEGTPPEVQRWVMKVEKKKKVQVSNNIQEARVTEEAERHGYPFPFAKVYLLGEAPYRSSDTMVLAVAPMGRPLAGALIEVMRASHVKAVDSWFAHVLAIFQAFYGAALKTKGAGYKVWDIHLGNFAMFGKKALMIDYAGATRLESSAVLPVRRWIMHYVKRRVFGHEMDAAGLGGGWKEVAARATKGLAAARHKMKDDAPENADYNLSVLMEVIVAAARDPAVVEDRPHFVNQPPVDCLQVLDVELDWETLPSSSTSGIRTTDWEDYAAAAMRTMQSSPSVAAGVSSAAPGPIDPVRLQSWEAFAAAQMGASSAAPSGAGVLTRSTPRVVAAESAAAGSATAASAPPSTTPTVVPAQWKMVPVPPPPPPSEDYREQLQQAYQVMKSRGKQEVHLGGRWEGVTGRQPALFVSDSTGRVSNSKGSRQVDYLSWGNGFADQFNAAYPGLHLLTAIWSGGKLPDLYRVLAAVPAVFHGITLVWMGNDYYHWHKPEVLEHVKQLFGVAAQELLSKSYDARMVLFGPPQFWNYGSDLVEMVVDMQGFIESRRPALDPRLLLSYAPELMGGGYCLVKGHFAGAQEEKVCKLLYSWMANQRFPPTQEPNAGRSVPDAPVVEDDEESSESIAGKSIDGAEGDVLSKDGSEDEAVDWGEEEEEYPEEEAAGAEECDDAEKSE